MYSKKHQETEEYLHKYLEKLYEKSIRKYINTTKKESTCFEIKKDLEKIKEYTTVIEDYIINEIKKDNEYKKKIKKLKRIKQITILNHNIRDNYNVIYTNDSIDINPNISIKDTKRLIYKKINNSINGGHND